MLRNYRTVATHALVAASFAGLAACDNPNPGVTVGTYSVASALSDNSCGADVAPTDPGSFDVTISNDQGTYYWFPNTGASAVSGGMNAARTVSVTEVVADDVDETDAGASGPCTLQRNDTLSFTLAAGATPASFTGSYSFTVSPAIGANCADQLVQSGGGYTKLPCTTTYTLTGKRQ
jgi:hypothetical protein